MIIGKKSILTLILFSLIISQARSQELQAYQNVVENGYNFWVYTPPKEVLQQNVQQPLVIFLHGHSLCGNNLDRVRTYGPLHALQMGRKINAMILAPQNSGGSWNPQKIHNILQWVKLNYTIDPNRIYVFGMSQGGYGTIDFVGTYPNEIAAAIAMCGGGQLKSYCGLNDVPLWIIHGTADRAVPVSQSEKVINGMKACGNTPRLIFTKVKGIDHGGLARAFYRSEPYEWLLSHRLDDAGRPVNTQCDLTPADLQSAYADLRSNTPKIKVTRQKGKNKASAKPTSDTAVSDNDSTEIDTSTPTYYTIKKGDSLTKIAKRHHTTVTALCKLNKLQRNSKIQAGKRIRVK